MSAFTLKATRLARIAVAAIVVASALPVALASAATPPTALTGPVSGVGASSVTVTGTVNPNGTDTSWSFEYGTSVSYGSKTSPQNAGSGSANSGVSANLTGLSPGTTYHYRLDATSTAGPSDGSDGVFTTLSAPGAVTGPATSLTTTSATLTGTVQPNGQSTTYSFEYGKTTSYGTTTAAASAGSGNANSGASANLTGLTPDTAYHYRLDATSTAGTTQGSDATFTTSSLAPGAVAEAVTNLTATAATLNGTVQPNGQSTTYFFEYGKTTSYGSATPTMSAGSGTTAVTVSAAVSGLTVAQTYHFRVVAMSNGGTTQSPDLTFTPYPSPTVSTATATVISGSSAQLNGTVTPNGQQTSWYFQYGSSTSYGSTSSTMTLSAGTKAITVSANVSGLSAATVYHFRLVATNASGATNGSDRSFETSTPPVVQTGSALGASATSVTLTGSVNPEGKTTNSYFEYGTTGAYGASSPSVSAGSGTAARSASASISGLTPATSYHYRIVATSKSGTSYGNDVTFTTPTALTLAAETSQSVYGFPVTLSGNVSGSGAGIQVSILSEPFGQSSFATLASVLTTAGGAWSYQARPTIATAYEARSIDGTSAPVTIGVRPAVSLHALKGARLQIRVVASVSFKGRSVKLQRLRPLGGWATIARRRLDAQSAVIIPAALLPRGHSTLRVAMSINQAGRGFLAGFSPTLAYLRK